MFINGSDIFLISCNTIRQKSQVNKNVDDAFIQTAIKSAEDIYLVEVLGFDLVQKLCTLVNSNTLTGDYETLLKEYVSDYLCFKVMSEIQIPLWAKTRNEGIVQTSGTEYQPLSRNDVNYTKEYYDTLASGLIPRMIKFLNEHTSTITEWKPKLTDSRFNCHICL